MNIYENNKQLLTTMGGDSANLATDYEVRKAILDLLGGDSSKCNSIYEVDKQILNIYLEGGGGTGGGDKAKVYKLQVSNDCIVDGYWPAENFDTSLLTSMSDMFNRCTSLQSVDVSNWDTSNVTSISQMFYCCSSLQSVDVSNWDTSNVTSIYHMFSDCSSLQTLDVSGWDTSNMTDMSSMFSRCQSLQTLDVSGWDTSNVTNMNYLFNGCSSLKILDLSGWDTSNVKDIGCLLYGCGSKNGNFNAVGGRTIDEVISGNIGILNGLNKNILDISMSYYSDRATLRALINGVADRTGQSSLSMSLGSTLTAKLTEEDIAIATAKNWTIA